MACVENRLNVQMPEVCPFGATTLPAVEQRPLPVQLLPAEREFYASYSWSLNIYPTVREVIAHLRAEVNRLSGAEEPWQRAEMLTNIFLFCCAIANEVDDYLVGRPRDFSKLSKLPLGGAVLRAIRPFVRNGQRFQEWRLRDLRAWRDRWHVEFDEYLQSFVSGEFLSSETSPLAGLITAFSNRLPAQLLDRRLRNPAFFHGRDLTHFDILSLGDKFVTRFPDPSKPIVLVGLRTAGSYFAPLVRAYLRKKSYENVELVTLRPRSTLSQAEKAHLASCAKQEMIAVLLDEAPIGGGSTAEVIKHLEKLGFHEDRIVALLPIHRLHTDWKKGWDTQRIAKACALTLEPHEWYKEKALATESVGPLLNEYFQARGYLSAEVINSSKAERLNFELQLLSDEKYHTRHKKIYEVHLQKASVDFEVRFVFAKSVGWGWLSYHAFTVGERLSNFVPPVLGLRNGFLYTEWRPQASGHVAEISNAQLSTIASYIAARKRTLPLHDDPSSDLIREKQHTAHEELLNTLSRAYGSRIVRFLKRPEVQRQLARYACPYPTLIDGKMRGVEWVAGSSTFFKADFEHHGMGKKELEMTDPAYDLAEAILHFKLSEGQEHELVTRYSEESGDLDVNNRLLLNKLLAGRWSMNQALANIRDTRLLHRVQDSNRQYLDACDFLTRHTMRFCAAFCNRPKASAWRSPIVALDIDGVIDKPVFGYPSTTAAGIEAIALLHSHGFVVALDTARSLSEVKDYCQTYGFVGGVAEYGSAIWDVVAGRERALVGPEALAQLDRARKALRTVPGIFINEDYQYSIRAYTYSKEQTSALPTMLIQNLIGTLNLDQLRFHQTTLDTAILAKSVDKGTGLIELINGVSVNDPEIIAIGDSEPDLAMFRVTTRSYAPSHIWCRAEAEALGCRVATKPLQSGLLESVRSLIHPDGKCCELCKSCEKAWSKSDDLILRLLQVADQKRLKLLMTTAVNPRVWRACLR